VKTIKFDGFSRPFLGCTLFKGEQMKLAYFLSSLILLGALSAQAQLSAVKLGTTESQLLSMAQARTRQADGEGQFELRERTEDSYSYRHVEDGYQLEIHFKLQEGEVVLIKSTHIGTSPDFQATMRDYYVETVKDWHNNTFYRPNPQLAAKAIRQFDGLHPEAAAFTDSSMSLMFLFLYHLQEGKAVFTRLERKF
jgi:hypothetical protein